MKSFTIPESVKELGEGIFAGCTNIEKFDGKFVKYNGKAIVYNKKLISVAPKTEDRFYKISEIDKNIEVLGESCFYGCDKLIRVDIPTHITEIKKNAFKGCINLLEVHFDGFNDGSLPQEFGEDIFEVSNEFKIFVPESKLSTYDLYWRIVNTNGYDYLKYLYPKPNDNCIIYYGEHIGGMGEESSRNNQNAVNGKYYIISNVNNSLQAYFSTQSVEKVILGENITEIQKRAFKNCTKLEYIYLPNKLTKIGDECFYGCEQLTSINIPNKPNIYIEQNKEPEVETIANVDIEEGFESYNNKGTISFGNDIFYGCKKLEKFISYYKDFVSKDNRCYIDGGKLMFFAEGNLFDCRYSIPTDVNIHTIYKSAFKGTDITNIVISSNVSKIEDSAFEGCTSLGGISLSSKLKTIGESAFEGCKNMYIYENLSAFEEIEEIGNKAFMNCENFKYVIGTDSDSDTTDSDTTNDIPLKLSKITSIGNRAFENCKLLNVELNENIKHIGNSAFKYCEKYIGEVILNNVESIGSYCFENSGIKKLTISSENIKTISNYAFSKCKKLKDIILSDSITFINAGAFEECEGIENDIYLPLNLSKLGKNSFANKETQTNIYITSKSAIPPIFVYTSGREAVNGSIYPFGKNDENVLPNIYIPNIPIILLNINKNDKHWSKYKDNMSTYSYIQIEGDDIQSKPGYDIQSKPMDPDLDINV